MSNPVHPIDVVLGELSDEQRVEADRLMREDPDFRRQVEELSPLVSALEDLPDEAWDPPATPPLVLPTESRPETSERRGRFRWPELRWPAAAAAAACAIALLAIGVGLGVFLSDDSADRGASVALAPVVSDDQVASGRATVLNDDEVEVDVAGLPASSGDEIYELWLLNSPDDLVSLGSFSVDESGEARVRVPLPVEPAQFAFFDISVEPTDGDPAHSGRSVLRAPTSA